MKYKLSNVSSRYGAPMGRCNTVPAGDASILIHLERMPWVDGDYDPGGAYWGRSPSAGSMWVAWADDFEVFVRGTSRSQAKEEVREIYNNVRFYR